MKQLASPNITDQMILRARGLENSLPLRLVDLTTCPFAFNSVGAREREKSLLSSLQYFLSLARNKANSKQ